MNRPLGFLLAAACWLAGLAVGRAGETPRVINFDPAHPGGGISQNWMIAQSAGGRMYFAQTEGLTAFDGQNWQRYHLPRRQIVRAVAADDQHRVYVGGYAEFGYWEEKPGRPLRYTSLSAQLDSAHLLSEEIWSILVVKGKGVIFQSFSTLFYYDFQRIRRLAPPGNIMFLQEVDGRIIVPVIGRGLYVWNPEAGFSPLSGTTQLPDQRVKGLLSLPDGGILIATEQQGLWAYRNGRVAPWPNEAQALFEAYQINRAVRLKNGWLAFGSILSGLIVLDQQGRLRFHLQQRNGMQNNTVLSLLEDRHGDLWVGLDQGIDLVVFSDPLRYYTDKNGQLGSVYAAAFHEGHLYLGANQGLYRRDADEQYRLLPGTQGQVWELQARPGSLFIGHNNGAFALEGARLRTVSTVTGGWQMLAAPHNPNLAIQCTYTGLAVFRRSAASGQWVFSHRLEGLLAPLRQMAFDAQGQLWVVHAARGLYRLRLAPDFSSIAEQREWSEKSGLPDTYAMSITALGDSLLFRSGGHYHVFEPKAGKFRRIERFRGQPLPDDCNILAGQGDDWFISSPNEAHWFKGARRHARLPVKLVPNYPKIEYLANGQYLFCLRNGYAILPADASPTDPGYRPPPEVAWLIAATPGKDSTIGRPSAHTPLVFSAQVSSLRFFFAQPIYSEPVRFRYRLRGFDNEWSDWTALNQKEFTNLPQGEYALELQSDYGPEQAVLRFTVLPHWSETRLARLSYLLLFSLAMYLLYRAHQRRLQLQARRMLIERERSIQQERIRTQNAQLEADILRKSQELANSTFNLVKKNEILIQIKDELGEVKTELGPRMPERHYQRMQRLIDSHMTTEQDWQIFETNFNEVHDVFFKKLKRDFPNLSPGDLRLAAYLKMNLSSKEIAPLLKISIRGVENKRYRLRQKLGLDPEANLTEFLMGY